MTQLSDAPARTRAHISERTLRKDQWWRKPIITAVLLTIWELYATVRVFTGHWYFVPQYHYLTPFYSPCVSGECVPGSSSLGTWIPAVPPIIPYAFATLPFILGFRLTCYYYRGAYYRSFWQAPTACAVREPHARYSAWTQISRMNTKHMQLAWITLGTLMLTDLYILLVASGAISDLRFFN